MNRTKINLANTKPRAAESLKYAPTIDDPDVVKLTNNPDKLTQLHDQVKSMAPVFDEANRAKEAQRKMMDDRHSDVLRRIEATREFCKSETTRLENTIKTFQVKFGHELKYLDHKMFKELNDFSAEVRSSILEVDQKVGNLEVALQEEREERIRQTREILEVMCKQAEGLEEGLDREKKLRVQRELEIEKLLEENVILLNKQIDSEKFKREQQQMGIKKDLDHERDRISKRQFKIQDTMEEGFQALRVDIEKETDDRNICQDGIVDNVNAFIQKFQENVREEGRSMC